MLKENIFHIVYPIVVTILLLLIPNILPSLPFLKNTVLFFYKHSYIKLAIKCLIFIYIVQLSGPIHELGHLFNLGKNSLVNIPKTYYIPFIGFKHISEVETLSKYNNNNISIYSGIAGFVPQILYLLLSAFILFKSSIAISLVSISFIIYMFIHYITLRGGDFFIPFYKYR
jgi:hypothetical protein